MSEPTNPDMTRPWAVVGTTPGEVLYPDGEPASKDGEAIVRLANYGAMKVPEAFEGCAPISLALRYADDDGLHTLAGIHVTPEEARCLAADLMRAADITEATSTDLAAAWHRLSEAKTIMVNLPGLDEAMQAQGDDQ